MSNALRFAPITPPIASESYIKKYTSSFGAINTMRKSLPHVVAISTCTFRMNVTISRSKFLVAMTVSSELSALIANVIVQSCKSQDGAAEGELEG
jgi:hypothetical protein